MKRIFRAAVCAAMAVCCCIVPLSLYGCGGAGQFFPAEVLEERGLSGLPQPEYSGKGAQYEAGMLSCNVKENAFTDYARSVYEFLCDLKPLLLGTDGGSGVKDGQRRLGLCEAFEDFRTQRYAYTFVLAGAVENGLLLDKTVIELVYQPSARPFNTAVILGDGPEYALAIDYTLQTFVMPTNSSLSTCFWGQADNPEENGEQGVFPAVTVESATDLNKIYGEIENRSDDAAEVLELLDTYGEEFFLDYNVILVYADGKNSFEYCGDGYYYDGAMTFRFTPFEEQQSQKVGTLAVIEIKKNCGVSISSARAVTEE